jgi:hypothetical protein
LCFVVLFGLHPPPIHKQNTSGLKPHKKNPSV